MAKKLSARSKNFIAWTSGFSKELENFSGIQRDNKLKEFERQLNFEAGAMTKHCGKQLPQNYLCVLISFRMTLKYWMTFIKSNLGSFANKNKWDMIPNELNKWKKYDAHLHEDLNAIRNAEIELWEHGYYPLNLEVLFKGK